MTPQNHSLKNILNAASSNTLDLSYRTPVIFQKKRRILNIPNDELKALQRSLNDYFQDIYTSIRPDGAYGYMRANAEAAYTHVDAASRLMNSKYIYKFDIKNFFNSVKTDHLRKLFEKDIFNLGSDEIQLLLKLVTFKGRLPFGAPSSPSIINLLFYDIDKRLESKLLDISDSAIYCRYCDDIIIGIDENYRNLFKEVKRLVQNELDKYNLQLNKDKSHILTHSKAMYILGLKVNEKINLDRKYIRNLRATMHKIILDPHNAIKRYQLLSKSTEILLSLRSKIEYVGFVRGKEDPIYKKLLCQFEEVTKKVSNHYASLIKTTQFNNQIYEERRLDKSGIFEQFLTKFDNKQSLETFLEENNLVFVIIKVPVDQNLQDGKYFSIEEDKAPKEDDLVAAVVYKDAQGKPTNKIAFLKLKEAQGETDGEKVIYEVIPFNEAFPVDAETSPLVRGESAIEDDYEVRTVSILQSVVRKEDDPRIDEMARGKVQVGRAESFDEAKEMVLEEFKELNEIRDRATKGEVVQVEILETTPGANRVFDSTKQKNLQLNIATFENERFARVELYSGTAESNKGKTFAGYPYLVLLNSASLPEFEYPLMIPTLESDSMQIGGKSIIDNLGDILFLLQEDFSKNYGKLDSELNRTEEGASLMELFADLLYKPKQNANKARRIVIKREPGTKDKPIGDVLEYVDINFILDPSKENTFFSVKRYKPKQQKAAVESLSLTFKGEKKTNLTPQVIKSTLKSALSGVKMNTRMKYLRTDEKRQNFGYINVNITPSKEEGKPSTYTVEQIKVPSYIQLLGQLGVTVPIMPAVKTKTFTPIERKPNEPYQRIGKGIIFQDANKPENKLEEQFDTELTQKQAEPKALEQPASTEQFEVETPETLARVFNIQTSTGNESLVQDITPELVEEEEVKPVTPTLQENQIEYTKEGKTFIYTVEGEVITNNKGTEVYKNKNSKDRKAILALAKEKFESKESSDSVIPTVSSPASQKVEATKEEVKEDYIDPSIFDFTEKELGDIDFKVLSAKSLPRIQASEITEQDVEKVKSIFGGDINIQNLFETANSDAWATWTKAAITLYKGANRSDLYHEAWHNFSQLYLTVAEKKALYNEIRSKVEELKGATDLVVEEWTAREFSKFAIAHDKYSINAIDALKVYFESLMKGFLA